MAGEKKKGRRAYLDDFTPTVSGGYVYSGQMFLFDGDESRRRRLLGQLGGLWAAVTAAELLCGLVRAPGATGCFYVVLPYVGALVASFSVAWGLIRLVRGGPRLRAYVYEATVEKFPLRLSLAALCAGLALAGECLFVFRHGAQGRQAGLAVYLAGQGAALAGALLWRRLSRKLVYRPQGR